VTRPPRLAETLLSRRLARDERDELIGDINEQFARRVADVGASAARRWYWRQALALVWGFGMRRRDLISTSHDRVRGRWLASNIGMDARYAWRALRGAPGFAMVTLLTLTFGVGLSTAVFSLVNGVVLQPLPYAQADRLVRIVDFPPASKGRPRQDDGTSMGDVSIGAWMAIDTALAALAPYDDNPLIVRLPSGAANTVVSDVSPEFFRVLAMPAVAGRTLGPADIDRAAPPAAVISERLAWSAFGGPQAALGQTIGLETTINTIVGVMPSRFAFPNKNVDVWRPGYQYRAFPAPGSRRNMAMRTSVIGLLKDGATLADLDASGTAVSQSLVAALVAAGDDFAEPTVFQARRLLDDMVAPIKPALTMLTAGTILVLIAVCANLANLLLARNTARQREFAVRLALGAGRWRVGRPALIEVLMLAGTGGAAGALLAWWLLRTLPGVAPASFPRIENIHFDVRTLAFAAGISLVTALIVGWLPTLQMPATNVQELTSAGGSRLRVGRFTGSADILRGVLVTGQIALAAVLLVVALLIGRSFSRLIHVDLGYNPNGVLTLQAAQTFAAAREEGRLRAYYTTFLERLRQQPSVVSAGFGAALPMHPIMIFTNVQIVGREAESRELAQSASNLAVNQPVSADYLKTIGTRIVEGRGFTESDTAFSEKVLVIDDTLRRLYFPAGDAIGQHIKWSVYTWKIVGVAQAMHMGAPGEPLRPVMYFPTEQLAEYLAFAKPGGGIAVKTSGDPRALIPVMREIARSIDPSVPLYNVQPLDVDVSGGVAQPRFFAIVLGLFSAFALSTALLGIYGVLAYAVERRRLEFGIRRALGATEGAVMALVMRRAVLFAVAGLTVGLFGAGLSTHFISAMLFGVTPADPLSFVGTAGVVLLVVLLAAWRPVRQALRIDPARALRIG
jgi:predicted permease